MRSTITLMFGTVLGSVGLSLTAAPAVSEEAVQPEATVESAAAAEAPQMPLEAEPGAVEAGVDEPDPSAEPLGLAAPETPEAQAVPAEEPGDLGAAPDGQPEDTLREAEDTLSAEPAALAATAEPEVTAAEPEATDPTSHEAMVEVSELGGVGYDSEGRRGRIHVVIVGDTLWDISDAYLGTPWVWPSIWQDNGKIDNPHLIHPGDRIWITDGEMRLVSAEEAAILLAGEPPPEPAAPSDDLAPLEALDPPEEQIALPSAPAAAARAITRLVSSRDSVGLVTEEVFDASASVVESELDKVMLSQGDRIYIGLGAGDVRKGDQFTVFRKQDRVFDPDTGRLLGYHVEVLGWITVEVVAEEASLAKIEVSHGEIERGDRLMPREEVPLEIALLPSPGDVEGRISFFGQSRTMMGMIDFVYLNRGTLDGLEVGSPLQVYRIGPNAIEAARDTRVRVPDRVIADLLVVRTESNSAVAYVTHSATEVELGDHFRGRASVVE